MSYQRLTEFASSSESSALNDSIKLELLSFVKRLQQHPLGSEMNYRDEKKLFGKAHRSVFSADSLLKIIEKECQVDQKGAEKIANSMIEHEMIICTSDGKKKHMIRDGKLFKFTQKYLPRMVILGGGHAGITVAQNLYEYFNIILIDKNDVSSLKPSHPIVLEKEEHAEKISVQLSEVMKNRGTFIRGLVRHVTPNGVFIETSNTTFEFDSLDSTQVDDKISQNCKFLKFEYLVIATGSSSWKNKLDFTQDNHPDNKIHYVDPYSLESVKSSVPLLKSDSTKKIVLIGGGFIGVEFTGSLAFSYPKREFILIQRGDMLMKPSEAAHKVVSDDFKKFKNLKVMFNSQVTSQKDGNTLVVKTSDTKNQQQDGSEEVEIDCAVCYLCSGGKPNTDMLKGSVFESVLDDRGYIKVNKHFQLLDPSDNTKYLRNIFALSDVNNLEVDKLMQNARLQSATFTDVAKLLVQHSKESLPSYDVDVRVKAASVGPKHGFVIKEEKVLFSSFMVNKLKGVLETTVMKQYRKTD
ncbi:hypothetical protein C9374_014656 [Naegleria lovaniensis]|uniref:FAD/NAD(P)-binding domain-containing protein n=1 Tax=Naegleria lovaniensis TaxID=51637 RepID=A0AA88H077_NAELO|nr:uncharacterized protein C9374_014656 [Naegleria lovaniensis]KAG2389256.1 hypothetical protein C9374_014656 [Naegleria lovaniensis]